LQRVFMPELLPRRWKFFRALKSPTQAASACINQPHFLAQAFLQGGCLPIAVITADISNGNSSEKKELCLRSGVTRWVCKKIGQNVAQPIFLNLIHDFYRGVKLPKNFGYFFHFQKHCPKETITQSGHPVS
jgi:hypothetical protein